jgi:hypothetical protein
MSKQTKIEEYINTIIGGTVTTKALCEATNTTLPTVLTYIRKNPQRFHRVARGTYTVLAASTQSSNNSTHEW